MALLQNWNLEFLAHNSQRRYPLAAEATTQDVTGDFRLPDEFLVSLYLSVPISLVVEPANFLVTRLQAFATGFALTLGYWTGSEVLPVAAGSFLRATHQLYRSYPMRGLGDFYDVSGHFTIGRLDMIDQQPPGDWEFDLAGGRLEVDAIRPQIRGVTQLQTQNGTDLSIPLTGDVILRAGRNFRITPRITAGQDIELVLDAIDGAGLNEDCICEGTNPLPDPIRTINGIPPTLDGNFTLLGTSCLTIQAAENGLQLDDKCADPCCGCKELEPILAEMSQFGKSAATLETLLVSLEARVSQMDQVVLGSKLGDQGCPTTS
jgi:hypothetical protein